MQLKQYLLTKYFEGGEAVPGVVEITQGDVSATVKNMSFYKFTIL